MTPLSELLQSISLDKEPNEQLDKLKQFDSLSDEQLNELISSKHVKDGEAGIVLRYLGYEKVKNKIPEILSFLQDINWPAWNHISILLSAIGEPIIPEIQNVFKNEPNDKIWHQWIIVGIIKNWDNNMISILKEDLIKLVIDADKEGASIESLTVLKRILTNEEYLDLFKYLIDKYKDDEYWINELKTIE